MPPLDLVIVIVYLVALVYVGYRAFQNWVASMEDVVTVKLDQGGLDAQLQEQGLQGKLVIKVSLKDKYKYEVIPDLSLMITNNLQTPVYVDWDRSVLTNFAGRSRRVIRVTPSLNLDLSRPQIFSVIGPGQVLSEKIVAEDMLKREADGSLKPVAPIVDLSAAGNLSEDKTLTFSLRLVFGMAEFGNEAEDDMLTRALLLIFSVRRIPGTNALPWNLMKKR